MTDRRPLSEFAVAMSNLHGLGRDDIRRPIEARIAVLEAVAEAARRLCEDLSSYERQDAVVAAVRALDVEEEKAS